jgi:SAM-dependent methyltransferase
VGLPQATRDEIHRRNRELYDDTFDPLWDRVVYRSVHAGWEFVNLGGRFLLEEFARVAQPTASRSVLELCSGPGAACRYLAERHGCHVTGVEMNAGQLAQARKRLQAAHPLVADRVRFVEADALEWRTDESFDAGLCLDSAMLVADVPALLATARAALRPGAPFLLSAVAAGPRIDDEVQRFAWESDGMISLLAPEAYAERLRDAGFVDVGRRDLTALAIRSSERMQRALRASRAEIVAARGAEAWECWHQAGELYLSALRDRRLAYALLVAA